MTTNTSHPLSMTPTAMRKRLSRYLNRGGVLVREICGGAIGVRWARAARNGADFDAALCEDRLASGKLRHVAGSQAAYELTPPRT